MEKRNTQTSPGALYFRHEMFLCFSYQSLWEQGRASSNPFSCPHHPSWPQGYFTWLSLNLSGDSCHSTFPEDSWTLLSFPADSPVWQCCHTASAPPRTASLAAAHQGSRVPSFKKCVLWPAWNSAGCSCQGVTVCLEDFVTAALQTDLWLETTNLLHRKGLQTSQWVVSTYYT